MDPERVDLLNDLTEPESALSILRPSRVPTVPRAASCLSNLELPVIFDFMDPRSDLDDSFVSDLLNDG